MTIAMCSAATRRNGPFGSLSTRTFGLQHRLVAVRVPGDRVCRPALDGHVTRSVAAFESISPSIAASTTVSAAPTAIGALISLASSVPFLFASRARVNVPLGTPTVIRWTSAIDAVPSVVVVTETPANWNTSLTTTPWPPDGEGVQLQREVSRDADRKAAQIDRARHLARHAGGGDDERAAPAGQVQADIVGGGIAGRIDPVTAVVAEEELDLGEREPHDLGARCRLLLLEHRHALERLSEDADLSRIAGEPDLHDERVLRRWRRRPSCRPRSMERLTSAVVLLIWTMTSRVHRHTRQHSGVEDEPRDEGAGDAAAGDDDDAGRDRWRSDRSGCRRPVRARRREPQGDLPGPRVLRECEVAGEPLAHDLERDVECGHGECAACDRGAVDRESAGSAGC